MADGSLSYEEAQAAPAAAPAQESPQPMSYEAAQEQSLGSVASGAWHAVDDFNAGVADIARKSFINTGIGTINAAGNFFADRETNLIDPYPLDPEGKKVMSQLGAGARAVGGFLKPYAQEYLRESPLAAAAWQSAKPELAKVGQFAAAGPQGREDLLAREGHPYIGRALHKAEDVVQMLPVAGAAARGLDWLAGGLESGLPEATIQSAGHEVVPGVTPRLPEGPRPAGALPRPRDASAQELEAASRPLSQAAREQQLEEIGARHRELQYESPEAARAAAVGFRNDRTSGRLAWNLNAPEGKRALIGVNNDVAKALAKHDAGVPFRDELSHATLEAAERAPRRVYDRVFGTLGRTQLRPEDLTQMDGFIGASRYPKVVRDMRSTREFLSQPRTGAELQREITRLRRDGFENAGNIGPKGVDPIQRALGEAQLDTANLLEEHVERNINPRSGSSITQYRDARQAIARTRLVAAVRVGTDIDMAKLARIYNKNPRRISGGLREAAEFASEPKNQPFTGKRPSELTGTAVRDIAEYTRWNAPYRVATKLFRATGAPERALRRGRLDTPFSTRPSTGMPRLEGEEAARRFFPGRDNSLFDPQPMQPTEQPGLPGMWPEPGGGPMPLTPGGIGGEIRGLSDLEAPGPVERAPPRAGGPMEEPVGRTPSEQRRAQVTADPRLNELAEQLKNRPTEVTPMQKGLVPGRPPFPTRAGIGAEPPRTTAPLRREGEMPGDIGVQAYQRAGTQLEHPERTATRAAQQEALVRGAPGGPPPRPPPTPDVPIGRAPAPSRPGPTTTGQDIRDYLQRTRGGRPGLGEAGEIPRTQPRTNDEMRQALRQFQQSGTMARMMAREESRLRSHGLTGKALDRELQRSAERLEQEYLGRLDELE
jgi:hypothetical protein